jgi:CheY-like chemotaxis protein
MNHVHIKALTRAAAILGGSAQLANRLGIPPAALARFMAGEIDLAPDLFLRVVDIVVNADLASLRNDPLVLVVEDDPATAYSLSRLIKELGYQPATATSGQSALDYIRSKKPAVAFVDLRLPDLDGRDIARIIRAEKLATRVVAVTAYGNSDAEEKLSLAAGFEKHFLKPIDLERVETVIPRRPGHDRPHKT